MLPCFECIYIYTKETRLTEGGGLSGDDHGSVHGSLELPASIEPLESSDSLLPVHGGGHPVSVLEWKGRERERERERMGEWEGEQRTKKSRSVDMRGGGLIGGKGNGE